MVLEKHYHVPYQSTEKSRNGATARSRRSCSHVHDELLHGLRRQGPVGRGQTVFDDSFPKEKKVDSRKIARKVEGLNLAAFEMHHSDLKGLVYNLIKKTVLKYKINFSKFETN